MLMKLRKIIFRILFLWKKPALFEAALLTIDFFYKNCYNEMLIKNRKG